MELPRPTVEFILAEGEQFDRENDVVETSIHRLVEHFPSNTDPSHVLLKVTVINQLYRTNVLDVRKLAGHITSLAIDPLLRVGSQDAVCQIADIRLGRAKVLLSFATKYCNWHNFCAYPIFDSNAALCLWEYNKQEKFVKWKYNDLESGNAFYRCKKFFEIATAFRDHYGLTSVTCKELDKFLYRKGIELASRAVARAAGAGS